MIELIFVIVVLGILAAIAIPKFAATRDDAIITKGRSDIAAVRSGIVSDRQKRIMRGSNSYITDGNLSTSTTSLFDGVLTYPITASSNPGGWSKTAVGDGTYTFHLGGGVDCQFTYNPNTGAFNLSASQNAKCDDLVK